MTGTMKTWLGVLLPLAVLASAEAGAQCVASATNFCVETDGSAYLIDSGSGAVSNPSLTLDPSTTYTFVMGSSVTSSHPFVLETPANVPLTSLNGVSGSNPAIAGQTITWTPNAPGAFAYRCTLHSFGGSIVVRPFPLDAGSDAGLGDAGVTDAGFDAGITDSGVTDSGVIDSGVTDSGVTDSGVIDAGEDAGLADAGANDGGPLVDAGFGSDAGSAADGGAGVSDPPGGCGCGSTPLSAAVAMALGALVLARRRRFFF